MIIVYLGRAIDKNTGIMYVLSDGTRILDNTRLFEKTIPYLGGGGSNRATVFGSYYVV